MNKKDLIVNVFSGSPETWTAEQIEKINRQTGESISRDMLRRAYNVNKNNLYRHIANALNESLQEANTTDFESRLYILLTEILPAFEMLSDLRQRIEKATDKNNGI